MLDILVSFDVSAMKVNYSSMITCTEYKFVCGITNLWMKKSSSKEKDALMVCASNYVNDSIY
jgi:hypothetical protein